MLLLDSPVVNLAGNISWGRGKDPAPGDVYSDGSRDPVFEFSASASQVIASQMKKASSGSLRVSFIVDGVARETLGSLSWPDAKAADGRDGRCLWSGEVAEDEILGISLNHPMPVALTVGKKDHPRDSKDQVGEDGKKDALPPDDPLEPGEPKEAPPLNPKISPEEQMAKDLIKEANRNYDESRTHYEAFAASKDAAVRKREVSAAFDAVQKAKEGYQKARDECHVDSDWLNDRIQECLQRYKVLKNAREGK